MTRSKLKLRDDPIATARRSDPSAVRNDLMREDTVSTSSLQVRSGGANDLRLAVNGQKPLVISLKNAKTVSIDINLCYSIAPGK